MLAQIFRTRKFVREAPLETRNNYRRKPEERRRRREEGRGEKRIKI
jgi:hypothetical protein